MYKVVKVIIIYGDQKHVYAQYMTPLKQCVMQYYVLAV